MSAELKLYEIDLQTEISADLYFILSSEERSFLQRIRNETLQKQHIKVRAGVRLILAAYLKQSCDKINIAKTVHGKPYLPDYPEIQFNISHSGNLLLVAISPIGSVGIDIEQLKPRLRDFSGLVAKCFAPSEITYWNALPESEKAAEFYQFWTRKEAFVKAVGRGLAIGLEQCVIVSGKQPYFLSIPENYGFSSDWRLFDLTLTADLYGAIVLENSKIPTNFVLPEIMPFQINQA
jgi:4'-phosphopantetheinyl transferase